ncbi:MAG: LTA synthase family protein [Rhodothermaceae bacterium]
MILAFLFAVIYLANYSHYYYFGVLPNNISVNFLMTNTTYAFSLILDSFHFIHFIGLLFFIALFLILLQLYHKKIAPPGNKKKVAFLFSFCVLLLFVSNNNIKIDSRPFTNLSTTLVNFANYTYKSLGGKVEIKREMFTKRIPEIKVEEKKEPAKINFLLFVSESVRDGSTYSEEVYKKINPFVNKLTQSNKIIRFKNYYANSNSTLKCLYSITSGRIGNYCPRTVLYYDYLKASKDIRTFFITSQTIHYSNMDKFYGENIDLMTSRKDFDQEEFSDTGVNDFEVLDYFKTYIDTLTSNFAGIIQFNNTHYPYKTTDPKNNIIKGDNSLFESYLNTIYEQDQIVKKYFEVLKNKNLLDSTIIIFISDHGESFNEHNISFHNNSLYNEQTKVPFWIYIPEKMKNLHQKAQLNQNNYFSHLDIFPTVLDIFDITPDKSKSLTEGISIFRKIPEERMIPLKGEDMVPCYGYIRNNLKYVNMGRTKGNEMLVFNLSDDPKEKKNIYSGFSTKKQTKIKNTLDSLKTFYKIK